MRLEVRTSGCCEPILAASFGEVREGDLVETIDDLQITVEPDTYRITGEICIEPAEEGFPPFVKLIPTQPLSEWSGFIVTSIENT